MTPDERDLLQRFLSDLEGSRGAAKDPEADGLISAALRSNPDGAYLLVQHAMLADQALQAAQQRIEQLQGEGPAGQGGGPPVSFLGGGDDAARGQDWRAEPAAAPPPQSPLSQNGGLGGFLRSAGTMAAGVAGGEFLAQGLSNLFAPRDW